MNWDLQRCKVCNDMKRTLYGFKNDKKRIQMCKKCYKKN